MRDFRVAELDEVSYANFHATRVVKAHERLDAAYATVEHHQRGARVVQLSEDFSRAQTAGQQETVDAPPEKKPLGSLPSTCEIVCVADQEGISCRCRRPFGATENRRIYWCRQVRDDHGERC
jgi:hypothetical protein